MEHSELPEFLTEEGCGLTEHADVWANRPTWGRLTDDERERDGSAAMPHLGKVIFKATDLSCWRPHVHHPSCWVQGKNHAKGKQCAKKQRAQKQKTTAKSSTTAPAKERATVSP